MFNTTKIATKVIRTLKSTPISRKTISISSHSIKATNSNKSLISLTAGLVTATIGVTTATLLNLKPEWKVEVIPTLNADAPIPATTPGIYIDPQTKTPFPSTLKSDNSNLVLIGTGVRVVSFLSVKVYCAAIYVDEKVMNKLSSLEGWKGFTADKLLPPFPKPEGELAGEELIAKLLDTKGDFAVIITPLRSTTLPHLRDGFARAIVARLKQPHVAASFSPEAGEGHAASISELKGFFPNRPLAKGAPLYVHISGKDGSARFCVNSSTNPSGVENLGTLHDPPLARQLFLSYFGDSGAISEELRKSAAKGFEGEPR